MPINNCELDAALQLALRAAHGVACTIDKAIEERDTTLLDIQTRENGEGLITQYDKQCEEEIIAILRLGAPSYDIISEELHSDTVLTDAPTWMVSTINGTSSFIHGLFDCCVSIALVVDKEPVIGVVNAPRLHEVYSAIRGRGAYLNGQRIRVSETRSINQSVVYLHNPCGEGEVVVNTVIEMQKEFTRMPVHALRVHGSVALDMCFIATGRAELFLKVGVDPWDVAAATVIVREAGGVVHDIDNLNILDLTTCTVCCANSSEISNIGVGVAAKHGYKKSVLGC
ncbi:inositol-1(or 4)-monophosphatase 1, putative [Trypanosoma brucei gambiense DAL972]|uniref:Inositol-1-monophosphatase n=1 Tax=Trypanosoma brucei gambiense (strain MHOM/CI/86/DAL972) TaxID=679716 RepID=C9ZPB2_TRYB9|nr:inositol-1(or 4)-monophosphatase 1, putative [Trypanosoma brucei gambiense DAL972]CBH11240.1 inositol-1(or 4)-monophosphatase 1, putative [Trypanosoma brucei gambiense DAL972]|eukprot:XP_011773527.1 inositol-1(or 4)-monophosphatase 1, putative [Trypanosoma brucei gambiense DAL972]